MSESADLEYAASLADSVALLAKSKRCVSVSSIISEAQTRSVEGLEAHNVSTTSIDIAKLGESPAASQKSLYMVRFTELARRYWKDTEWRASTLYPTQRIDQDLARHRERYQSITKRGAFALLTAPPYLTAQ